MLARWRGSDAPAIVGPTRTWDGAELIGRAAGAAELLAGLVAPGPVPALLASSHDAIAYLLAGADTGRPLAPLGPRLTVHELRPCVERLGAQVILTDDEFAPLARQVGAAAGCRVEVLRSPPLGAAPLRLRPDPSEPAFYLHTSGTTGLPKAVAYSQGRLAIRTRINAELCALGPGSVYASASGFHHIAGLGNYAVALGSGAAVAPMPRFTVEAWSALADLHVTHALTVPTMLEMLLDAGVLPLPDLVTLQYGAAPIHPATLRRTLAALPDVRLVNLFGQTEGSPVTCLSPADHRRIVEEGRDDLLHSVGRAVPGVEVRIDTPDDAGIGEVIARGPHFFAEADDGWLHTGDFGRLDRDGYLFLSGRKGDKIVRGGENVYPAEVERVLQQHPGVAEAAVIGVPDQRWGEVVCAVVVPVAEPPDPAALRSHVRATLAGFKVPTGWVFTDALPRNANGKLLRRELGAKVTRGASLTPSAPTSTARSSRPAAP